MKNKAITFKFSPWLGHGLFQNTMAEVKSYTSCGFAKYQRKCEDAIGVHSDLKTPTAAIIISEAVNKHEIINIISIIITSNF